MERAFGRLKTKLLGMTKFNSIEHAKIKMSDCIITTTEKTVNWGDEKILIPKGTGGLVCEVYTEGAILAEVGDNKKLPWILATFYDGEYKKNDQLTSH